ncbi:hypothetical protein GGS23DRAFT_559384, partial [Durotheca rogersii]|uniref:uncharacterized protein n=1 Tax=Durotheca rogersii TaxID=419775 RepID=UPI00221E3CB9
MSKSLSPGPSPPVIFPILQLFSLPVCVSLALARSRSPAAAPHWELALSRETVLLLPHTTWPYLTFTHRCTRPHTISC